MSTVLLERIADLRGERTARVVERLESAATFNLENAMRQLARAGAVEELLGDQALAGAYFFASRALCSEIGRNWDWVASGARSYAEGIAARGDAR